MICSIVVSTRDLLTWVQFMNSSLRSLHPAEAFFQGAHLVFPDALGCGSQAGSVGLREGLVAYIRELLLKAGCGSEEWRSLSEVGEFEL